MQIGNLQGFHKRKEDKMTRARWLTFVVLFAFTVFGSTAFADTISVGLASSAGGPITTEVSAASGGIATWTGGLGAFTINAVSAIGGVPEGTFDSNSLDVTTSGTGTLYVYVTDQGVSDPSVAGAESFISSFTENSLSPGLTVTETTYIDTSNGVFTTPTELSSYTFGGPITTPLGVSLSGSASLTGNPYSLTEVYAISSDGSGVANSTIDVAAAPEPSSFSLLALVLLSGLLVMRKRVFA
jgi:hypothetical protein